MSDKVAATFHGAATDLRDAEERIALLAADLRANLDRHPPRRTVVVNRATLTDLLDLLAVRPVAAQERIDTALKVLDEYEGLYGADHVIGRFRRALTGDASPTEPTPRGTTLAWPQSSSGPKP